MLVSFRTGAIALLLASVGVSAFLSPRFSGDFSTIRRQPAYSSINDDTLTAQLPEGAIAIKLPPRQKSSSSVMPSPVLEHALPNAPPSSIIVGGGPAGLATAIMLARRGWSNILVVDRLAPPPEPDDEAVFSDTSKFYLIGLGSRGQKALQILDAWDEVSRYCTAVVGRKDWSPEGGEPTQRIFVDRPYLTQVLARDRLAGVLKRICETRYTSQISLQYSTECSALKWNDGGSDGESVTLTLSDCATSTTATTGTVRSMPEEEEGCVVSAGSFGRTVTTPFLVGADGAGRSLVAELELEHTNRLEGRTTRALGGTFGRRISKLLRLKSSGSPASSQRKLDSWLPSLRGAVRTKRYVDDNVRVYKTVPMTLPAGAAPVAASAAAAAEDVAKRQRSSEDAESCEREGSAARVGREWRCDVNYSARTKDGRINYDALPASDSGEFCGVLLLREADPLAAPDTDPGELRRVLDESLPQFSALIDDSTVAAVAAKPPSRLPSFRSVGPLLHRGRSTVLLGDAVHTVKPYFGLGANSALEDVIALQRCLDDSPCDAPGPALGAFSAQRGPEAAALVRLSRGLDRPGLLGFVSFVLPIILDGIFHKFLPRIFSTNTIAMLQRDGITFTGVARKKRFDRALQVLIIATVLSAIGRVTWTAADLTLRLLPGRSVLLKTTSLCAVLVTGFATTQVLGKAKHMAPADAMAKTPRGGFMDKEAEKNANVRIDQRRSQSNQGSL